MTAIQQKNQICLSQHFSVNIVTNQFVIQIDYSSRCTKATTWVVEVYYILCLRLHLMVSWFDG